MTSSEAEPPNGDYLDRLTANLEAHPEAVTEEMTAWVRWVDTYVRITDPFASHATVPKDPKPWGY